MSLPSTDTAPQRCAWCGRTFDESSLALKGRIQCGACGVATTDPWPSAETLAAAYSGWYRPASGRFAGAGDKLFRFTRGRLSRRIAKLAPPGPILDVGAGEGALVDA